MSRKFRLALQYLTSTGVEFDIDFFTFAIEANAYDIVFYLRYRFEEQIFAHNQKAIDSHVQSYQNSSKFLKSKLHLSKSLLPIFNFNGVKEFLKIMNFRIFDHSLENNIFSHSANPLLSMCLLYEFLSLLTKKFFSLSYTCRQLMDQVKVMIIHYIESVDDETFLTNIMLEKDFTGRDSLQIAVELELLDLIQAPKVEAVIMRILNSDYETSGSFFEMSTPYQILNHSSEKNDVEVTNRFYKKRDIEGKPQYDSNFYIFQQSMNSRIKGIGIIASIYVVFSIYYFESCIYEISTLRPVFGTILEQRKQLVVSADEQEIYKLLSSLNKVLATYAKGISSLYSSFNVIIFLCVLNCMFFTSQVLRFIFLRKIGRSFQFPTVSFFSDFILMVVSIFQIDWIVKNINKSIGGGMSEITIQEIMIDNLVAEGVRDFKFEYLFAIIIICLIWKLIEVIQFSSSIGPMIKIVQKMFSDFGNFFILYAILVVMFAVIGNSNFV